MLRPNTLGIDPSFVFHNFKIETSVLYWKSVILNLKSLFLCYSLLNSRRVLDRDSLINPLALRIQDVRYWLNHQTGDPLDRLFAFLLADLHRNEGQSMIRGFGRHSHHIAADGGETQAPDPQIIKSGAAINPLERRREFKI